jgi:hypothetical protein
MALTIERVAGQAMPAETRAALLALCDAAYGESMRSYLDDIGRASTCWASEDGVPVSHVMWVTRRLQPTGMAPLRTAYVELVATAPIHRVEDMRPGCSRRFPSSSRNTSWRR